MLIEEIFMNMEYDDNVVVFKVVDVKKDVIEVEFYEDYLCFYCGEFVIVSDGDMKIVIEEGKFIVYVCILNFFDGRDIEGNIGYFIKVVVVME